jgi:Fe-S-cluster containining protein
MQIKSRPLKKPFPIPVRIAYSCAKCPGYCCSYPDIEIARADIKRIARHFEITYEQAEKRYTRAHPSSGAHLLRHRRDKIFTSTCILFDQNKRCCTIYQARPDVCRQYPDSKRCGYYDFLSFEREHQDDPDFIARA